MKKQEVISLRNKSPVCRLMLQKHSISWQMSSWWTLFISCGQQEIQLRGAWWIQHGELTNQSSCLNLHTPDLTSDLCKWVFPAQCTRLKKLRSDCQTRQCWSDVVQDYVTALPVLPKMFFKRYVLVPFSYNLRKVVIRWQHWYNTVWCSD